MSPLSSRDMAVLKQEFASTTDFKNFMAQYNKDREEDNEKYDGLVEIMVIVRLVGVRKIMMGMVLYTLAWPLLSHKIGEFLGVLSK